MLIRSLNECPEFVAGDGCRLREVLHPEKQDVALRYSLAHAVLDPGLTSAPHRLKTSEIYYVIEGTGVMLIDDEERRIAPGDTVYIPPNAVQSLRNDGDTPLVFLCIVDPAWREEDEEVLGKSNAQHPTSNTQ
jgi:mannose-6-phosphate isomerase-like protein (cupin superfamily)